MPTPHTPIGDEPGYAASEPVLYNVVYCSRAAAGVDDAVVQAILATARRNNPLYAITGMLVFGGGIFFQWLEGPRSGVESLMRQLRADRRHDRIVELSAVEEVRERLFPDWDMELVTADHIREVLQDALDSADDPRQAQALEGLLAELEAGGIRLP